MMNLIKKSFAFISATILCLNLTACIYLSDDTTGDDWRYSGDIVASGTIINADASMDVLVTLDDDGAYFYRDEPEQILFDSVSFPMTIPDAYLYFNDISFDDIDGDGLSDVSINFVYAPGDSTSLVWLWSTKNGFVFCEDLFVPTTDNNYISEYVGLWEYVDKNLWFRVYDDATWEFLNDQEDVIESGTLLADETGITLFYDGSDNVLQLDRAVSGDLLDARSNGVLVPAQTIKSSVPYFTQNGLEINAYVNKGTYLLKDGMASYYNLGQNYSTGDCYWEVIKNYDQTHNGIREIQFDAVCYIPHSSLGYFEQDYVTVVSAELYDFNSGKRFMTSTTYSETGRGENHYVNNIEWNGKSETIEFAYSTEWKRNVSDWEHVLTKSYVVYLPEGYDGLVFVAEPIQDNYKDQAKYMQLDSISSDINIMDIDLLNPYGCLFFKIC